MPRAIWFRSSSDLVDAVGVVAALGADGAAAQVARVLLAVRASGSSTTSSPFRYGTESSSCWMRDSISW